MNRPTTPLRHFLVFCLFEAAFYFAYRYGMSFSQATASPFWFPDSVLLCALLLSRPQHWWVFVLGPLPIRLFSEVAEDIPQWFLLTTFAIDSAKGLLAATALRRSIKNPARLETVKEYGLYCLFAVLLVPALAALAGAGAWVALGNDYWTTWERWFLGNALTHLVVTPPILYWVFGMPWKAPPPSPWRCLEAVLLTFGLILAAYTAFDVAPEWSGSTESRFYAPVPFLFWAALRFGMFGACGAITIIAVFGIDAALDGRGPFSLRSPTETALALQHFLLLRAAPLYLVAVLVEQRRSVERSLRESEERYREVVESQTELVCRYRPDSTLTFVNHAYCRFFGKTREELIGRSFLSLIPSEHQAAALSIVRRVVEQRVPVSAEHEVLRPDGTVAWMEWQDFAIFDERGKIEELQGIGRDVTERHRSAEALAEAERHLHHASRLALVGELTASIAHEINQPLGAILSNAEAAEMLLESGSLDEVRRILADIRRDDLRASEVIQHVRALVGKRAPHFVPLQMNDVVTLALRLAAAEARRRGVTIDPELGDDLPEISGEPVQLKQLLLNLVINGMEAMGETPPRQRRIVVRTACERGRVVELSVADAGHGIAPERLPRIFESFFTTKESGMGLGLALVRSIAEGHRGTVAVENNASGGATFRLRLPVNGEHTA